ncbi:MAG TPA: Rrf2 family transcriptional regulator [Phycisphaerae bacterium]|nr:Rrf2 family transcriptional regulator [Phycisphaerae bacterium]
MLALTKKTGYGLAAMTHLAGLSEGRFVSAREIAQQIGAPTALTMNVLKELAASGYVKSARGARGGYRLARRPEDITVANVVGVLEGPVRLAKCVTDATGDDDECSFHTMASCPVADPVHRVQRRLRDFLNKVTLAEIVDPLAALART